MKLILASNSKTRKEILDKLDIKYQILPSNIQEKINEPDPYKYCMELSKRKARAVASSLKEGIILAADSIAYLGNKKLEKPQNKEEAIKMLKLLSNNKNYALTGVTIIDLYKNQEVTFYEETEVYFEKLSDEEIEWYVENESFLLERAGYSLGGKSAFHIYKIKGDYYNVLGLPIFRIHQELKKMGHKLYEFKE